MDDPEYFCPDGENVSKEDIDIEGVVIDGILISGEIKWVNGKYEREPDKSENIKINEAIEYLCYQTLEELHGGWETDDGSEGCFEIFVESESIQCRPYS